MISRILIFSCERAGVKANTAARGRAGASRGRSTRQGGSSAGSGAFLDPGSTRVLACRARQECESKHGRGGASRLVRKAQDTELEQAREAVASFREDVWRLREALGEVIVGQDEVVTGVLVCLFANGHALLEGLPGLGKTMLVRALSDALELTFSRLQFTPDLMPADVTGSNLIVDEGGQKRFEFRRGPVFAHVVLADEINRATPKTQSALLEAMQERSVTAGGQTRELPNPFMVLATQNPIDLEGTYPLPEAQLDRFLFKILVKHPEQRELAEILDRTTAGQQPRARKVLARDRLVDRLRLVREVPAASKVRDFVARLVSAARPDGDGAPEVVTRFVRYGASPRGAQALLLGAKVRALMDGRFAAERDDVKAVAHAALRHRLVLNFEAEAEGVRTDEIVDELLSKVK